VEEAKKSPLATTPIKEKPKEEKKVPATPEVTPIHQESKA